MKVFDAERSGEVRIWVEQGFDHVAKRAIVATAMKVVSVIQTEIIPMEDPQPVDRGLYRAGWRFKKTGDGVEVFNTVPHAPMIEWGVRAENVKIGRVMIDALEKWVIRKGIGDSKSARGIAFAIANKMKQRGVFNREGKKGLRILEKAVKKIPRFLDDMFRAELRREFP